ncbi:hypothetical protein GY45DRAFT_1319141 [Cubamyces sp. BRFM 1775]|nr:hypothetical protein GY45DRAFT_1319141 [Cubamyces sp. BRFM 1775]
MYPADAVFVDNTDSSITYTDPALAHQDGDLSSRAHGFVSSITNAYSGTLAVTTAPGMSFEFIFYGRILQMYGAVIPWLTGAQPVAEYSIDDDPEWQIVPNSVTAESNVSLYVSTLLPLGFHTLTVNVVNASADGPYLFDYIVYGFLDASEDPNPPNATSTTPQSAITSSPSSGSSSSAASTSTPQTTHMPEVKTTPFPTGGVIGGVVAAVLLLCAVAGALYWLYHRRRYLAQGDRESIEAADDGGHSGINPDRVVVREKGLSSPGSSPNSQTTFDAVPSTPQSSRVPRSYEKRGLHFPEPVSSSTASFPVEKGDLSRMAVTTERDSLPSMAAGSLDRQSDTEDLTAPRKSTFADRLMGIGKPGHIVSAAPGSAAMGSNGKTKEGTLPPYMP